MPASECYYVYILHCSNNTYYTGYTTDLHRRSKEHAAGTDKCKYTRSFKPLCLAQSWCVTGDKATAMRVEKFIKQMKKTDKTQLILFPQRLAEQFACEPLSAEALRCINTDMFII